MIHKVGNRYSTVLGYNNPNNKDFEIRSIFDGFMYVGVSDKGGYFTGSLIVLNVQIKESKTTFVESRLTVLGETKSWDQAFEIMSDKDDEFGFTVSIYKKPDTDRDVPARIYICHNRTWFDHRYDMKSSKEIHDDNHESFLGLYNQEEDRSAFESDIHQTGCWQTVGEIDKIVVEKATSLNKECDEERNL